MIRQNLLLPQGIFGIDPHRECVVLDGIDQFLRHQSFQILLYMLDNPNRVITKEELHNEVWGDIAVTDNALVQCIAEIRRVFQDDARAPSFIKTIPKRGYRLVLSEEEPATASLKAESRKPSPSLDILENPSLPVETHPYPHTPVSSRWQSLPILAACVALLTLTAAGFLATRHRLTRHITPSTETTLPKTVLLQHFQNHTSHADLDWLDEAVPEMLADSINHVPQLSAQVVDTQPVMLPTAPVPDHEKHPAVITGDISLSGDNYVVEFTIRDENNQVIGKDQTKITRDELPLEANLLASVIAGQLGVVANDSTSVLDDAATTNAEAFRYYRVGVERARQFKTTQAVEALTKAVSLDSSFAMAYARLGYTYAVTNFATETGQPYLDKAWQLSGKLPEKQRLYIAAWRAISKHQFPEALALLKTLTERYPGDDEAFVQLANLQRAQERPKESEATLELGLHYSPRSQYLYNSLAGTELMMHQYSKAFDAARQYVALAPEDPNARDTLGMVYQQAGRPYEALTEYSAALLLDPGFEAATVHMGDSYYQVHRLGEAAEFYKRYISIVTTDKARAIGYGNLATVYRDSGDMEKAQWAATEEHRYNPKAVWNLLVIAVDKKQENKVRELEKQLEAEVPTQERGTPGDLRTLAYERGWLALQRGNKAAAIASFQEALRHQPPTSGIHWNDDWLSLDHKTLTSQRIKSLIQNNSATSPSPDS